MKTRILLTCFVMGALMGAKAQLTLTFTAANNDQHVPLDSILVQNLTQGGDTILYSPDSVLVLDGTVVGVGEIGNSNTSDFSLSQNYPNPMNGKTTIRIYLSERKDILITVSDIVGRELINKNYQFGPGHHNFHFYPGGQSLYLFNVSTVRKSQTIKMINSAPSTDGGGQGKLEYIGKQKKGKHGTVNSMMKSIAFELGDELQYTAHSALGNVSIVDTPLEDQTYTFQYASAGLPCPNAPTVTDIDGNVYNTVLIGSECWMKENLKTTTYNNEVPIPNVTDQEDWENLSSSAYAWYENDISWKDPYGAMYNGYVITDPDNDICPSGWHVPTIEEWGDLFNHIGGADEPFGNELKSCRQVDSPLGVDCNTTEHPRWDEDNMDYGTDDYGFAGLPSGQRTFSVGFDGIGAVGYWWSATEADNNPELLQTRYLHYSFSFVGGSFFTKKYGFSVRCVKD